VRGRERPVWVGLRRRAAASARAESVQAATEYALVLALVSIIAVATLWNLSGHVFGVFAAVAVGLGAADGGSAVTAAGAVQGGATHLTIAGVALDPDTLFAVGAVALAGLLVFGGLHGSRRS